MRIQSLGERIILFMDEQHHHENVVVLLTDDGPVIVDAFRSGLQFAAVEEYLAAKGHFQPALQIFTHWHPDHTRGNQKLAGIRCLANEQTWAALERYFPAFEEDSKREGYSEKWVGHVAGLEIQLHHAPGHTLDSTLVYVPRYKLVIAGDNLVGPEVEFFFPPVQAEDRALELDALPSVYRQIRKLSPKLIIPGHGWVLPPDEMLALNEHRFKNVLKRSAELVQRALQWPLGSKIDFGENLIRAWLGQAGACATIDEQEALKENVNKVLRQVSQKFEEVVFRIGNPIS